MIQSRHIARRLPYLRIAWGPTNALAKGDLSRLRVISADLSPALKDWLRFHGPSEISEPRTHFLVQSFLQAMNDQGWNPQSPPSTAEPLRFGLLFGSDLAFIVVTALSEGPHPLRMDLDQAPQN